MNAATREARGVTFAATLNASHLLSCSPSAFSP